MPCDGARSGDGLIFAARRADARRMTTIDDVDLFGDAFAGFRSVGVARHRHRGWLSALALLVAAGMVAVAFVWARGDSAAAAPDRVEAHTLLAVLAGEQGDADVVASSDLEGLGVRSASTRFLVETPTGAHYAAVGTTGDLCLLTVPSGALPSVACVASVVDANVAAQGVWVSADGGPAPAADEGWREAGPNLWVRD